MKKVFVLNVDSYNEFGQHLGTNVVGVYTTRELAQQFIDSMPKTQFQSFEEYLDGIGDIESMSAEDIEIMHLNYEHDMSYPQDEYNIAEFALEGE